MNKFTSCIIIFFLLCMLSCGHRNKRIDNSHYLPKVIYEKGVIIPRDSISEKPIMSNQKPVARISAKAKEILVPTNERNILLGKPMPVGKTFTCTPGQDTFKLPSVTKAIDSSYPAGIPEKILVKEPNSKDYNPYSIFTYSKLQGLKHNRIVCMIQANDGKIWFGSPEGLTAYDGKYFYHYGTAQGLIYPVVNCICQDENKNLWLGTDRGAFKFDGKNFTYYSENQGFGKIWVNCIKNDGKGNLWFGTVGGGAIKYDGISFTHYTRREGLFDNIQDILIAKNGEVWFSQYFSMRFLESLVCKFDSKKFIHFDYNSGLTCESVTSILQDRNGNIWFAKNNGLAIFDGNYFTTFRLTEGKTEVEKKMNNVSKIIEDKFGNIWFLVYGYGIYKYDGKKLICYSIHEGLSSNQTMCLMADIMGNLWIGNLLSGISVLKVANFKHFTEKDGLINNYVTSVTEDSSHNIYTGTFDGLSILTHPNSNPIKYVFKNFSKETDIFPEGKDYGGTVRVISQDAKHHILIGTSRGMVEYDGRTFSQYYKNNDFYNVNSLLQDQKGIYWVGSNGSIVKRDADSFRTVEIKGMNINQNRISIAQDKNGNIWFGDKANGIAKYDGTNCTQYFKVIENERHKGISVFCVYFDRQNNVWFGTWEKGVYKYDGKTFTNFTTKDGLLDNSVKSIIQDKDGNLWFGTPYGLSKLSKRNLENLQLLYTSENELTERPYLFKNYSYEDGFLGDGCNPNALCEDSEGTLWIGTPDRLTSFHPNENDIDTVAPNLNITGMSLFNEQIPWQNLKKDTFFRLSTGVTIGNFKFDSVARWTGVPQNLSLAYNNNYISIEYIGISINSPKKIRYKYKLEGVDKNWSTTTDKTEVNYSNLSEGKYTFRVKAMNGDGYWSGDCTYFFTIRPPWWKTWWAYLSYLLIGVVIIARYITWKTGSLVRRQKELEDIVAQRTAEVVQEKKIVEKKSEELQNKNKEITDNIHYAQRIQSAILPDTKTIYKALKNSFILYQPKDIVSGDFYGFNIRGETVVLIAADCTGHGVSGAFMSMIGSSLFNQIVIEKKITTPALILDLLNIAIIDSLNQAENESNDGMDVAICTINTETNELQFAGANRPLWIVKNNEFEAITPNKYPIGGLQLERERKFTNHIVHLQENDTIYFFSDGFADQFGGEKGKKMTTARFRETILSIQELSMIEQEIFLRKFFEKWKGNNEQVDDVLVVGIRV